MSTHRVRRSVRFVPAVRPDRLLKAVATGADAVCVDLEDGVSFEQKDDAREKAIVLLAERPPGSAWTRMRTIPPGAAACGGDVVSVMEGSGSAGGLAARPHPRPAAPRRIDLRQGRRRTTGAASSGSSQG